MLHVTHQHRQLIHTTINIQFYVTINKNIHNNKFIIYKEYKWPRSQEGRNRYGASPSSGRGERPHSQALN